MDAAALREQFGPFPGGPLDWRARPLPDAVPSVAAGIALILLTISLLRKFRIQEGHGLPWLLGGLALVLFSLTVVSFPLLLDRDVDFVTAMITSVRAVVTSPAPMIGWAAVIVVLLIVSALPYFLGLLVTLPLLGHATWHLYRRIVAPVAV